ncbi:MAG TPA: FtsX-like permease family protein [Actinomycetota bacterium]|nr:FtsX-like permease family protein [Actinomycetota bacterium]
MWKATLKGLLSHKLRLISTALAVILGVAFVSGSLVMTDTMGKLFEGLFADVLSGVDVSVRSEVQTPFGGRERVPEELVQTVAAVPGVKSAEGGVAGFAQVLDKKGNPIQNAGAPSFGVSWGRVSDLTPFKIRSGSPPEGASDLALDAATARKYKFKLGDEIQIVALGAAEPFKLVGIMGFGSQDNLAGATISAYELRTAQRLFDAAGKVDGINAAATEGVRADTLAERIDTALEKKYEVITAADSTRETAREIKEGLSFFSTFLLVFAGIALFVGTFLIFNTFSIILTQRTREFGLLRALGATGAQIVKAVLAEAAIIGTLSSIVGLGLGVAFAAALKNVFELIGIDLPDGPTVFRARTAFVSIGVGVVVMLVSAIIPALRTSRISPVAALREVMPPPKSIRIRTIVGLVMAAIGAGVLIWGLNGDTGKGIQLVGAGVGVMFLGIAVMAPVLVRPVVKLIGLPLKTRGAITSRLAQLNAMRDRRRTASTAAALMIGLSLVTFVTIFVASTKASFEQVITKFFKADFIISNDSGEVVPPEVAGLLAGLKEVDVSTEVRRGPIAPDKTEWLKGSGSRQQQAQKFNSFTSAVDPALVNHVLDLGLTQGSVDALARGEVLIHKGRLANESANIVGKTIGLEFLDTGRKEFVVGGVFEAETLPGGFLISLDVFKQNYTKKDTFAVLVKLAPDVTESEGRKAIAKATKPYPQLQIQSKDDFFGEGARQIDQLLNLVRVLLALAIFIAAVGIANTLALSVIERTRELGMLRAVGMTRSQIRSMVRWEAVFIGLLGTVLGLVLGTFFAWAVTQAIEDEAFKHFVVPPISLLVLTVLAALSALISALLPARRAARLNILDAVAAE